MDDFILTKSKEFFESHFFYLIIPKEIYYLFGSRLHLDINKRSEKCASAAGKPDPNCCKNDPNENFHGWDFRTIHAKDLNKREAVMLRGKWLPSCFDYAKHYL